MQGRCSGASLASGPLFPSGVELAMTEQASQKPHWHRRQHVRRRIGQIVACPENVTVVYVVEAVSLLNSPDDFSPSVPRIAAAPAASPSARKPLECLPRSISPTWPLLSLKPGAWPHFSSRPSPRARAARYRQDTDISSCHCRPDRPLASQAGGNRHSSFSFR